MIYLFLSILFCKKDPSHHQSAKRPQQVRPYVCRMCGNYCMVKECFLYWETPSGGDLPQSTANNAKVLVKFTNHPTNEHEG